MNRIRETVWSLGSITPSRVAATIGKHEKVRSVLRPLVNAVAPDELREVTVLSGAAKGARLFIYPRTEKFYWTGTYEIEVQEAIASILKPGDTFWDIGSHIGFFALLASRLVGPSGVVHAFEPSEVNRSRLGRNSQLNRVDNVRIHPEAVSDRDGLGAFKADSGSSTGHLTTESSANDLVVTTTSIGTLVNLLGPPSVVKVDVEGIELKIVDGASPLIDNRTSIFVIEVHDEQTWPDLELKFSGYVLVRLGERHVLAQPRR